MGKRRQDIAGGTGSQRRAFTLIEALVSISILAGMILMLAAIFRHSVRLTAEARGGAAVFETSRQVFEAIGRDLSGVTRDGFLFVRVQQLPLKSDPHSGLILCYDQDGAPSRMDKGRMDVMVMTTAGYQSSAVDAGRRANFARVIWGQSERASGNNLAAVDATPKYWAVNMVLSRHQTLMLPDGLSADLPNSAYGGAGRGADYFNMGVSDLTRFFGPAMGAGGGEPNLPPLGGTYGLFSNYYFEGSQELMPFRRASKVWRFGRSGPGAKGEPAGSEGAGDLTERQVDIEQTVPVGFCSNTSSPYASYAPGIASQFLREDCIRGQERPKVFGPKDYHRIAAFGVAHLQIDWSDGRRLPVRNAAGEWVGTRLQFYPTDPITACAALKTALMGPGEKRTYCWNRLSPRSVRDMSVRRGFGSATVERWPSHWPDSMKPANWQEVNRYTRFAFMPYWSAGPTAGSTGGYIGDIGWPWPRAIRVRMILCDPTQSPPVGYQFEQVFHLLVQ